MVAVQLIITFAALFSCQLQVTSGARILALMTTASPSHHIWNRSLMLALAARGHHVTVLSPDPEKTPVTNHTDIVIEGAYQSYSAEAFEYEDLCDNSPFAAIKLTFEWGQHLCPPGLASKGAQVLLKSTEKFDLIIVETAINECFLGFIHKFGYPPVVAITAFGSPSWASTILANPDNPSYIPHFLLASTNHMTFTERALNIVVNVYSMYYYQTQHMPFMDRVAREHFGESLPSLSEIQRHISLIMVNTHASTDYPRPLVPAMIPVGGMHIKPPQPLPQDLQKYLDEAKDGVIFFSLGTNLRSDQLGADKINILLDAFKQLPQRILWKWESDTLPGKPENVKLGKWLPQNDILAHPNVRLFITHAGLLSTQEAVYHGVPIVGIPFFADQHINIHKAVTQGVGEKLTFTTLSKDSILSTIRKVLLTPSYRENMKRLSAQFRDQPQSPLDRAVYWTEYVIRHKGAPHLRSAALDVTWYQYLLLDVIGLLLLTAAVGLAVVCITIKIVMTYLFGKRKSKSKSKQN